MLSARARTTSGLELGSLLAISNSAPDFGEGEAEDSNALFVTGGEVFGRLFETVRARSRAWLFDTVSARGGPTLLLFDTACSTPDAPLSAMLVLLNGRSVGDKQKVGGEGSDFEAVEPDRLTGTGMEIPLVISADTEGDCVGRILGSSSESALSLAS